MALSLSQLRSDHPWLRYDSATWEMVDGGLETRWQFTLAPNTTFTTSLLIPGVSPTRLNHLSRATIDALVLNLGLVEALSYWKTACPPVLQIAAGYFSPQQLQWWHHVLINGLGEFFYVNDIDFTVADFVRLELAMGVAAPDSATVTAAPPVRPEGIPEHVLVPMGGGKDSTVTLQLVQQHTQVTSLLINPTQAANDLTTALNTPVIEVRRQLDPQLQELNNAGYLNGHVPISAVYAWICTLVAYVFGLPETLVSNERSSNEGNVVFHGYDINHQFSKSFEFEQGFSRYMTSDPALAAAPRYFSFLRPLYELQIAKLFVGQSGVAAPEVTKQLRHSFRSCNRGQKQNRWCGECPKCLFAFTIFYPFIDHAELVTMFGKDLFATTELLAIAQELVGAVPQKPLECVGTREENTVAFYLCVEKWRRDHQTDNAPLPALLQALQDDVLQYQAQLPERATILFNSWNAEHQLSAAWEQLLRSAVDRFVTEK